MPAARRGVPKSRASSTKNARTKEAREAPLDVRADDVTIVVEDMAQFDEPINICVYGPSGVGKTVLAGGAPRSTFLTTEKGLASAKRSGSASRIMRDAEPDRFAE